MVKWRAPSLRFILIAGAFLLFVTRSISQIHVDLNCQQAYRAVISLRFSEVHAFIALEKKADPENLFPVYLENYIDFLTLVIGEEKKVYKQLKEKKSERLKLFEKGYCNDPFYTFCHGEIHLQWALIHIKFGDYTEAAFEIHKAHELFSANESRYPTFLVNKIGMGMIHVMLSLIPTNYKWVSHLLGLRGSMDVGLSEIRQVTEYAGTDKITLMYKPQSSFFLSFLVLNLQKNKTDAMDMLQLLENQTVDGRPWESPLFVYARATILMKNGFNEKALAVLQERRSLTQTFGFYYLDYLEGLARLNKLNDSASVFFLKFLAGFKGSNYIRSAYQKLAWLALLNGDSVNYYQMINHSLTYGASMVDEDKQAASEARNGVAPNIILLRARLLFDGGYYNQAFNELLEQPVKTTVKSTGDLIEYTYRLGRIYHETGKFAQAIAHYQQTISRGRKEPYYYAASAAYQLGLLYENQKAFAKAESAYQVCLSINSPEYQTSLHQKAKAGLNRLKKNLPKT